VGICLSTSCCDAAAAAAAAAAASAGVRGRCLLGNIQHRINRVSATLTETCYVLPAQLFRAKFGGRGPELLIGHSLGGKVLLNYLAQGATGLPLPKQASALAVCTHLLLHNGPGVCYQVSVIRCLLSGVCASVVCAFAGCLPAPNWPGTRTRVQSPVDFNSLKRFLLETLK